MRDLREPAESGRLAGSPVWRVEAPEPDRCAALTGSHTADVAIIGGGLTGVSTAMHLSERFPKLEIALLEAKQLGAGASGRNAGQVLHGLAGDAGSSDAELLEIQRVTQLGIDLAEQWSTQHAPPGTFRRSGCATVFTSAEHAEEAARDADFDRSLGIPTRFLAGSELRLRGVAGALVDPDAGVLNAQALLDSLRPVLLGRGVRVHEDTPVVRVRPGECHLLRTSQAELRARTLVLATNAYTPALGFFAGQLLTLYSHVLATEPLSDALWDELGWRDFVGLSDDQSRLAFCSRTAQNRLLIGGGSNMAYSYARANRSADTDLVSRLARRALPALREVMLRYMPPLADTCPAHLWSGKLAIPVDRICSMGVSGEHRNLYHALGYSGHGLALALVAGRVLADLYAGDHDSWRTLPFYQRRMPRWPPEPLRRLGYEAYTRLTKHAPRR